jgi:hypothetical protein
VFDERRGSCQAGWGRGDRPIQGSGCRAVGVCGGGYAGVLVGVFGGAERPPGLSWSRPVIGGCGECWIPTKEGLGSV